MSRKTGIRRERAKAIRSEYNAWVDGDGLEPDAPLDPLIERQDAMVGMRDNYGQIVTPTGVSNATLIVADAPALVVPGRCAACGAGS